jgi:hypothetical protein
LKLPPPVIPAVPEMLEGSPAPETSSSSAYSSTTTIINPPRPESESSETPAPQANIFSIDEERSMIRTIFNREEEAYQALLKKILESPSWNDAALIIDHYFTMHDVEPFTKEAILFTNRLQNYFATND